MLYIREAYGSVDDVQKRVEEAAVANHFGVLGVHDLKAKMAEKGVEFAAECRVMEVCNPHQAKKALTANMAISTVLPCRICLYEEGSKVKVATMRPTALLKMFEQRPEEAMAREVEEALMRIIDAACG